MDTGTAKLDTRQGRLYAGRVTWTQNMENGYRNSPHEYRIGKIYMNTGKGE
jgi:hypothetical protein